MATQASPSSPTSPSLGQTLRGLVKLARIRQWSKGVFVVFGPVYGLAIQGPGLKAVIAAFFAFALASSGCYVFNDLRDREADRLHPRKRNRPIAKGTVSAPLAVVYGLVLWGLAACAILFVPSGLGGGWAQPLLWVCVGLYVVNTTLYSLFLKRIVVIDVMSLAGGFVLRVLGGCAAAGVEPSSWLLNVTFFVSMFLALGKRLGERRTMGADAAAVRGVQGKYTDDFLRMAVVVVAVATLVSYSDYVQSQSGVYTYGFNLLWLTMIPATYCVLRAIVLLERGIYDDPTEMATHDRPFQLVAGCFALLSLILLVGVKNGLLIRLGWWPVLGA